MSWLVLPAAALAVIGVASLVIAKILHAARSGLVGQLQVLERAIERVERGVHDEMVEGRRDNAGATFELRQETRDTLRHQSSLLQEFGSSISQLTGSNVQQLELVRDTLHERLTALQVSNDQRLDGIREEARNSMRDAVESGQRLRVETVAVVNDFASASGQRADAFHTIVDERFRALEDTSARKLDEIRQIVDEKLQSTLDRRLGESFRQVSDRLEQVHRGLGEVQSLAQGVGDLKKVLANVRTRGGWGEVQLRALLEQMLSPEQYGVNVEIKPGSRERVEFAVRLQGPRGCYPGLAPDRRQVSPR